MPQHLEDGTANPEWLNIKAGKFSGSDFHQYMTVLKRGLSDTAQGSLYKKALEVFFYTFPTPMNYAMQWGIDHEDEARSVYEFETGAKVEQVGFCDYEQFNAGCSPDGVIYDEQGNIEKIIEIKCPQVETFARYLLEDDFIKGDYYTQIQFNLLITGAKSCDFVVYRPDFNPVIRTINADEQYQNDIKAVLEILSTKFCEIVNKIGDTRYVVGRINTNSSDVNIFQRQRSIIMMIQITEEEYKELLSYKEKYKTKLQKSAEWITKNREAYNKYHREWSKKRKEKIDEQKQNKKDKCD